MVKSTPTRLHCDGNYRLESRSSDTEPDCNAIIAENNQQTIGFAGCLQIRLKTDYILVLFLCQGRKKKEGKCNHEIIIKAMPCRFRWRWNNGEKERTHEHSADSALQVSKALQMTVRVFELDKVTRCTKSIGKWDRLPGIQIDILPAKLCPLLLKNSASERKQRKTI